MKFLYLALLVVMYGITPWITLFGEVAERHARDREIVFGLGPYFDWPPLKELSDPADVYDIFLTAASEIGVNVYRTATVMQPDGNTIITHYILAPSGEISLFRHFTLDSGRWLTGLETVSGEAIVTTRATGQSDIAGVPRVFAHSHELEFLPLRLAYDNLPVYGRYTVEAPSLGQAREFIDALNYEIRERGVSHVSLVLTGESDGNFGGVPEFRQYHYVPYIFSVIGATLSAAVILRQGKRIGVMRLLGIGPARVWWRVVGGIQACALVVGAGMVATVALTTAGADTSFVARLSGDMGWLIIFNSAVALCVAPFAIRAIKVSELVKGGL